jgi:hypothetical protein
VEADYAAVSSVGDTTGLSVMRCVRTDTEQFDVAHSAASSSRFFGWCQRLGEQRVEQAPCGRRRSAPAGSNSDRSLFHLLSIRIEILLKPDESIAYRRSTTQLHERIVNSVVLQLEQRCELFLV